MYLARTMSSEPSPSDIVGGWDTVLKDLPSGGSSSFGGGGLSTGVSPSSSAVGGEQEESKTAADDRDPTRTAPPRSLRPWEQLTCATDEDEGGGGGGGDHNEEKSKVSDTKSRSETEQGSKSNAAQSAETRTGESDSPSNRLEPRAGGVVYQSTATRDNLEESVRSTPTSENQQPDGLVADPTLSDLLSDGAIQVDTSLSDEMQNEGTQNASFGAQSDVSEGPPGSTIANVGGPQTPANSKTLEEIQAEDHAPATPVEQKNPFFTMSPTPTAQQGDYAAGEEVESQSSFNPVTAMTQSARAALHMSTSEDESTLGAGTSSFAETASGQFQDTANLSSVATSGSYSADYRTNENYSADYSAMEDSADEPQPANKAPRRLRMPESLMARTRSRADVDSPTVRTPMSKHQSPDPLHMIKINEDEEVQHFNTRIARKRVRVVQLLVFGLIGLMLGFFGGLFVQGSCHFATAQLSVGQGAQPFDSHYGLWKYTPMDSVFQGYSYCLNYSRYSDEVPHVPRIAGILSLVAGTYTMVILWTYLISGRASYTYWKWAVRMAIVAGVFQALTLCFLFSGVCWSETCVLGPGAITSVLSTVAWFILAYELHYNRPINEHIPQVQPTSTDDSNFVKNLELADFEHGASDYVHRLSGGYTSPQDASLNQAQRFNDQKLGSIISSDGGMRSPIYRPPSSLV